MTRVLMNKNLGTSLNFVLGERNHVYNKDLHMVIFWFYKNALKLHTQSYNMLIMGTIIKSTNVFWKPIIVKLTFGI